MIIIEEKGDYAKYRFKQGIFSLSSMIIITLMCNVKIEGFDTSAGNSERYYPNPPSSIYCQKGYAITKHLLKRNFSSFAGDVHRKTFSYHSLFPYRIGGSTPKRNLQIENMTSHYEILFIIASGSVTIIALVQGLLFKATSSQSFSYENEYHE
ncbi:hypothetical protein CEXT_168771 [Caerostris extrusa]|uniref:Uncharacterized protein n=1 Tax=Caerostris extrusa TaxID=172846 RepID=A0AAV4NR18_CAEEX|nr:hypothetical protein CEXT_168771 [Caerostris extrusa]